MIYFDNAATSYPKPPEVVRAVTGALESFGNPSRGAHGLALAAGRSLAATRQMAAELFGCPSAERVAFTKNITEALNIAIASVEGHIVTTESEHNSVLRPIFRRGDYTVLPVDGRGCFTAGDLVRALRRDTAAVALGHGSNLTGNLAPTLEIGRLCRERGLIFILDTAQTAGVFDLNMEAAGVDALCFTGHKSLYGPQGTGGICLSGRFTPRPLMVGGSGIHSFSPEQPPEMPTLLEAGTVNGHGLAGLLAGLEYVREHGPEITAEADRLARLFYRELKDRDYITFYGDYEAEKRAPIVTINVGELPSDEVADILAEDYGIAVRAGSHCAPLLHRRFGTETRGSVRFSFSHFNREDEVRTALTAIDDIYRR